MIEEGMNEDKEVEVVENERRRKKRMLNGKMKDLKKIEKRKEI